MENNSMVVHCSYDKIVPIDELIKNPLNKNKHPEKQIKLLAKIMLKNGVRNPIVVSNRSGFMTKGHGRLDAAILNGWTEFPVDFQDYESEALEYADMTADNKIAELAEHDDAGMIDDLTKFEWAKEFDFDLIGVPEFKLPDFAPASETDQGQLDKKTLKFLECPHCGEQFEQGQARKIEN